MPYSIQTSTLYPNTPFPQIGGQLGCISGYISNPDVTNSASVVIYGVNKTGKISRTIAPNGYLIFRSLEFEDIVNTSNINLEIVYSQDTNFLLEESQSIVNVGTNVNNLTIDVAQQDITLINQPNQLSGFYDTGRYILDGAQYVGVQIVLAPNQSILISRVIAYTVATVSSGSGNVITTGALSDDTGLINRMWLMLSNDYTSQYVPGSGSATIQSLDYYALLLNLTTSPVLNGGKTSVQVLHADFKYNRYVVNTSSSNLTLQIIYTQNSSQPSQNSGVIVYYEGSGTITTYTNGSLGSGSGGSGGGGGGGVKKIT
jgi:hypothetical protein